jgi:hypothetical protein
MFQENTVDAGGAKLKLEIHIPNSDLVIYVNSNSGKVELRENGRKVDLNSKDAFDKLLPFIEEQLQIRLDSDLRNALLEGMSEMEMREGLIGWASRVALIDYINHTKIGDDIASIKKTMQEYLGDNVSLNYNLNEISLTHKTDVKMVRKLGQAKGFLRGLERASVVRTGEGDALGTTTNSRLTGALHNQFEN